MNVRKVASYQKLPYLDKMNPAQDESSTVIVLEDSLSDEQATSHVQGEISVVGQQVHMMQEGTTSERIQRMIDAQMQFSSDIEYKTEFSKEHWTEFSQDESPRLKTRSKELTSVETIILAQMQEKWGERFLRIRNTDLKMGVKIGEGAEAEIFKAVWCGDGAEKQAEVAVKVFKGDIVSLYSLQKQWPSQLFKLEYIEENCPFCSGSTCNVLGGVMLKDKKYALVMNLYDSDLRTIIDDIMVKNKTGSPPFSYRTDAAYMYGIAVGMRRLHSKGIHHRDLKASNVLVKSVGWATPYCYVADFQCSLGTIGTGFWRAPEVLDDIKHRRTPLFTEKSDVYSYGMTCYEILTGKIPFEGCPRNNYDHVIQGARPDLPSNLNPDLRQLVSMCWHANPDERPYFSEILYHLEYHLPARFTDNHGLQVDWRKVGISVLGDSE